MQIHALHVRGNQDQASAQVIKGYIKGCISNCLCFYIFLTYIKLH